MRALACGVAVVAVALAVPSRAAAGPADARTAAPAEPAPLASESAAGDGATAGDPLPSPLRSDGLAPSVPADADSMLIGLSAIDLLGGRNASAPADDVGSADEGPFADGQLADDAEPFAGPPASAFNQRPATIPVPGALYLFPTGAALALYAGRRMRARCRRRG